MDIEALAGYILYNYYSVYITYLAGLCVLVSCHLIACKTLLDYLENVLVTYQ